MSVIFTENDSIIDGPIDTKVHLNETAHFNCVIHPNAKISWHFVKSNCSGLPSVSQPNLDENDILNVSIVRTGTRGLNETNKENDNASERSLKLVWRYSTVQR